MPKIEILNGKAAGSVVELSGTTITLGNRRSASVEIKDPWVSFNHAQITREGNRYFVADARSKAGTFVNDKRVDRSPVPLSANDRILLGKTEIRFLDDATPASKPAATAAPAVQAPAPLTGHAIPAAYAAAAAALQAAPLPASTGIAATQALPVPPVFATQALPVPPVFATQPILPPGVVLSPQAQAAPAVPAAPPAELVEKIAMLERDLAQANRDLKTLRETHVTREKKLAATIASLKDAQAQLAAPPPPPAIATPDPQLVSELERARAEAAEFRRRGEELAQKARTKFEELKTYCKELEARAASGQAAPTGTVSAAEKLALEASLHDAEERASAAERDAGGLRITIDDRETRIRELEAKLGEPSAADKALKQAQAELKGYEQALEERNKDVARLESVLAEAKANAAEAKAPAPAAAPNEGELAALRDELAKLKATNVDLRTQLEEINTDMLEQEDELRGEIQELERKLAEAGQAQGK